MKRVGAVVLAAGSSSRLGEAKQLLTFGGETLVARAVRVAREAGCAPVVVVLGARAAEVGGACVGTETVLNEDWATGMGSSVAAGVRALRERVDAAVVMTCDQPAVTAEHLKRLMAGEAMVVASKYCSRLGVPACFGFDVFDRLLQLKGDRGARDLMQAAGWVELPGGEVDVDTAEALLTARKLFGA